MPEVQQVFDAELVRVIDADTLVIQLDKFHGDQSTKTLRLLGVDAPELRTEGGKAARDFAASFLAGPLVVQTAKFDSFGRVLAYVWRKSDGASLGDALREAGHARAVSELAQLKAAREG
ncbi:MAG: thermonuclease family protein [Actinomycetota bacterium]|nr:thermonuclease family protein [Actinomycetota bacterium]